MYTGQSKISSNGEKQNKKIIKWEKAKLLKNNSYQLNFFWVG
jgi:hypothetical protein